MEDYVLDNEMNVGELGLTTQAISYLKESAKWARFLAIVGFVIIGLMTVVILGMGSFLATMTPDLQTLGIGGGIFTVFFLITIAIIFFPTLYLYRFATKTLFAVDQYSSGELAEGFKNLKSMFKFWGILVIIYLSLYALGLILSLLMFAFA